MIKKILALFALIGLAACGGAPEDDSADLGQTEEAINIGNGGYGLANTTAHLACAEPGLAGQNCFIPSLLTVDVGYCFDSGFTATEKQQISNGVENVDSGTAWNFIPTTQPCALTFLGNAALPGAGSVIEDYMAFAPSGTLTSLTSPPGASHVNGTWTSFTKAIVTVDNAQVNAITDPTVRPFTRGQIGGHAALLMIGQGTTAGDGPVINGFPGQSYSRHTVNRVDANQPFTLSPGEVCRVNGYGGGPLNQVSNTFACGI